MTDSEIIEQIKAEAPHFFFENRFRSPTEIIDIYCNNQGMADYLNDMANTPSVLQAELDDRGERRLERVEQENSRTKLEQVT